ncbi:hypothetical protein GCM10023238_02190 [Streptomyces heliomycini]
MLIDTYGRVATDLRVSLTDRCNLRCTYCMPEEGLQWLAKPDLLTDDEIVRLVGIAVTSLGIEEVRFTGGEPLLRPGPWSASSSASPPWNPRPQTSLTTNGIGLRRTRGRPEGGGSGPGQRLPGHAPPGRLQDLTRRDRHQDVLDGLHAAREAGLTPGEGQLGPDAGAQRRRGPRPPRLGRGARLRAALHRADAPGRPSTAGSATE